MDAVDFPVIVTAPQSNVALAVLKQSTLEDLVIYSTSVATARDSFAKWKKVADRTDGVTGFALHKDDLYLLTHDNAPHCKIIKTDGLSPNLKAARTIVPEGDTVIAEMQAAADGLYLHDKAGA